MPSRRPTLALTTPTSACFPAEALKSAASVRSPNSAPWREPVSSADLPSAGLPSAGLSSAGFRSPLVAVKAEDGLTKNPLSPPLAYMDFLKMASPVLPSPTVRSPLSAGGPTVRPRGKSQSLNRPADGAKKAAPRSTASTVSSVDDEDGSSSSAAEDKDADAETDSNKSPSTAASTAECSCDCERLHKSSRTSRNDTSVPASPFSQYPKSAPATGRTTFAHITTPISPAISTASRVDSPMRSPFSARTAASVFDWDSALKARYAEMKPQHQHPHPHQHAHSCASSPAAAASRTTSTNTSIRHIREVVTRTVTYTPRMNPPPKGRKRKVGCDEAPAPCS